MSRLALRWGGRDDENETMTAKHATGHLHTVGAARRTGGLWDALALATRDEDPADARRRLAALQLRQATASLADFEPCA